ncbi:MAG: ABC transporter substrate-binding protein [Akkermansia sp.]
MKTQLTALLHTATLLLVLLLLPACEDGKPHQRAWQAPSYESMPHAFSRHADVPDYARSWRAPALFQTFLGDWNRQGEHIRIAHSNELPTNLAWQDGHEQPAIGSEQAIKGGTMRIALQRSFPNTFRAFGAGSNNATRHYLYDNHDMPLVRQHPQTAKLIPGTARRWAVSADGKTVYFELDESARFSNDEPLRTQDYLTAIFLNTSPYAADPFYSNYYRDNFERITIYSNHVMALTLRHARPFAALYANIPAACTRFYAEFGPDFTQRYQWRTPPTTGGYTPDEAGTIMGRQMRLKRVKNWWARDRKFTRYSCNVDAINYIFINEVSKIRELFRVGEVDIFSTREMEDWYDHLEIPELHLGYIQRVHFCNIWPRNCFGFHLNASRKPLHDKNVRIGLHHAFNIQAVIEQIFRGDFTRSHSYFSGFGDFTNDKLRAREYSPEQARAYFAKAGYTVEGADGILQKEDGTRLSITIESRIDPLYSNAVSWLSMDAARCGVELKLHSMDDTLFFTQVLNKKPQCAIFSWSFAPPLPDAAPYFLSNLAFDAAGNPITKTNNITATANAELDAAIAAAECATDEQSARKAHHRIQELIHEDAAWISGWSSTFWRFAQWHWVRWPNSETTQFCPPRYYDPLDSHLYWIDPSIKKRVLEAQAKGESLGEKELHIPLPTP